MPLLRHGATARRIFSGIQPTGVPHLGNYLGALRRWVDLQDHAGPDDRLTFCIVDLHALTARPKATELQENKKRMLASLLAIGLDPDRSTIYFQSDVPLHSQLMWLLSCYTSVGQLNRMTQWKSKLGAIGETQDTPGTRSAEAEDSDTDIATSTSPTASTATSSSQERLKLGLFSYPVLQAADVLLHDTTHVPVGEDQAQHIELARDLATSLNHQFPSPSSTSSTPLLYVPTTLLSPAKRIMSLTDPTKKMSKSDANPRSRILLDDSADTISRKIRAAVTDSVEGVSFDPARRPGVSNLVAMLAHTHGQGKTPEEVAAELHDEGGVSMRVLKERVAGSAERLVGPLRERYLHLMESRQEGYLSDVVHDGAKRATQQGEETYGRICEVLGLKG